jgi:hypothetical protein
MNKNAITLFARSHATGNRVRVHFSSEQDAVHWLATQHRYSTFGVPIRLLLAAEAEVERITQEEYV